MQSFIINLKQSTARRERMEAVFGAENIGFEFFNAIDARLLSADEIAALCEPAPVMQRDFALSEIGCYLSHLAVWKIGLERNLPFIAVFEDDVHLAPGAAAVFASAPDWIPADADIVKLDTVLRPVFFGRQTFSAPGERRLRRLHQSHWSAAGYVLSRSGMQKLVERSDKLREPVDIVMYPPNMLEPVDLIAYQLDPAPVIQDQCLPAKDSRRRAIVSDIQKETGDKRVPPKSVKQLGFWGYLAAKLARRKRKIMVPLWHRRHGGIRLTIPFR